MASTPKVQHNAWPWCCLHCGAPLVLLASSLDCTACARRYPVASGVPILVRDPDRYLHSERVALAQTLAQARQSRANLEQLVRSTGLPNASLLRHRDVIDAEIARTMTLLGLLDGAGVTPAANTAPTLYRQPTGWTADALLPYLLRDWTDTPELEAMSARIGAALTRAFPEPSAVSVVFAACGAAGVLAQIDSAFTRVLGFDLTLPVLLAARRLLDGEQLELVLPHCISSVGRVTLKRPDRPAGRRSIDLAAMDVFDTGFLAGSIDCIVTSFLIDLIPDPRQLAREIYRILRSDGVWINYGPSGPLKALWRFDGAETRDFLEEFGFTVTTSEAYRTTYMDVSRDCPAWSFQNHICYLTCARKSGEVKTRAMSAGEPEAASLSAAVPQHLPGAQLIERRSFGPEAKRTMVLRHEGIPGRPQSIEVGNEAPRILALVDGRTTVGEIADRIAREQPSQPVEETLRAFAYYFSHGLLTWRSP